jgi:uncharacterized SAM-binding protein YcdF (DUF218 family)
MELGELKPILTTLVLPPAGPLLLALLGLAWAHRRRRAGIALTFFAIVSLFVLSTNAVATLLAGALLPMPPVAKPDQLRDVQAIVVLGGGVLPEAAEYGAAQPSAHTLARLRYGAWLARRTGKPLAFAGGVGWGAAGTVAESEGAVARRVMQEDYGLSLRWVDDQSRDTQENAHRMAERMRADSIQRIALVSDAWHLPRAERHFRAAGFQVLPAPTGQPGWRERPVLEWLPSGHGLMSSRQVIREWLGIQLTLP